MRRLHEVQCHCSRSCAIHHTNVRKGFRYTHKLTLTLHTGLVAFTRYPEKTARTHWCNKLRGLRRIHGHTWACIGVTFIFWLSPSRYLCLCAWATHFGNPRHTHTHMFPNIDPFGGIIVWMYVCAATAANIEKKSYKLTTNNKTKSSRWAFDISTDARAGARTHTHTHHQTMWISILKQEQNKQKRWQFGRLSTLGAPGSVVLYRVAVWALFMWFRLRYMECACSLCHRHQISIKIIHKYIEFLQTMWKFDTAHYIFHASV